MPRVCFSFCALALGLLFSASRAGAVVPDYRLGEVVREDIITPVPLVVVNPEATDALKQKVSLQVPFLIRQLSRARTTAETELVQTVKDVKVNFMAAMQRGIKARAAVGADWDAAAFAATVREVGRDAPKDFPLDPLAACWSRGLDDSALVESLISPVHEVMAQLIVAAKTDSTFPANRPLQLVPVESDAPPSVTDVERTGVPVTAGKIITLWRARRLVETSFPPDRSQLGRFSATFVRPNVVPDPALTEIFRSSRVEGLAVNDAYEPAQVVLRKGDVIDARALRVLGVLREKTLIGTLQTKLDHTESVAGLINQQTKWIAFAMAAVGMTLLLVLVRLRRRPSTALAVIAPEGSVGGLDPLGSANEPWRQRALAAEAKAERAHTAIRTGVLGWMRDKLFRSLVTQRQELLTGQLSAEAEMRELEQRLIKLHTPLQERIAAYEKRINELEKDLAEKGEANRELIGARIALARQKLVAEHERRKFEAN